MSTRICESPQVTTAGDIADGAIPAAAPSAVLDLLDTVWNHSDRATAHSWARVNTSMRQALCLAIGSGIKFQRDNFTEIQRRYRFHYWGGQDRGGFAEDFYGLAIAEGNLSAAQAFENWKGRPPFIMDNVHGGCGARFAHRGGHFRERGRLAVGSAFRWEGCQVTVTSFAADGSYLMACRYKESGDSYQRQVEKKYKITRADISAARRLRQQAT